MLTLVEEGLLSGLVAKSELREVLDEFYDELELDEFYDELE